MKILDLLKLSWTNIRARKFKSILYILIVALFSTLILCFFSGKKSFLNYIDNLLNSDYNLKIIAVNVENQDKNDVYKEISKIENKHIAKVFYDNYEIRNTANVEKYGGGITIYGTYPGFDFVLDKGKYIQNDNEIICSNLFNLDNWTEVHDINKYQDMNQEIGKYFDITYDKYLRIDREKTEVINTYNHTMKLVGTFNSTKTLLGYNVCFVSSSFFEKMKEEQKTIYIDPKLEEEAHDGLEVLVLVDKYTNMSNVSKELKSAGYDVYPYSTVDLSFFNTILSIINIVSIIILFTSIICVYLFIKSTLFEERKNIALYKLLGFNTHNMNLIFLFQYIINSAISFVISITMVNVIKNLIQNIIAKDPNYNVLNISVSYGEGILYMIFIILIISITLLLLFKNKIKTTSSIQLMEGNL